MEPTEKILQYIKQKGQADIGDMVRDTGLYRTAVYELLSQMTKSGQLNKNGTPPKRVTYSINPQFGRATINQSSSLTQTLPETLPANEPKVEQKHPPVEIDPYYFLPPYLRWVKKFNFDANVFYRRSHIIDLYLYGDFYSWQSKQLNNSGRIADTNFGRNVVWNLLGSLYGILICFLTVLSLLIFKGKSDASVQFSLDKTGAKRVGVPLGLFIILFLAGAIIAFVAHRNFSILQNELTKTKGQLAQAQKQLETQAQSSQEQIKALQQENQRLLSENLTQKAQTGSSNVDARYISMNQIAGWSKVGAKSTWIIDEIKSSQSRYSLIAEDINWLRGQGVSEDVIKTMIDTNPSVNGAANTTGNQSTQGGFHPINKLLEWAGRKLDQL